jgi:putative isomerase
LTGKKPLLLQGPEGWQPLWSGVASKEQAKNVITIIMDTNRFNTHLPFPTFQADHPWFDAKAYWRGPVWIDQAMFAIEGLRKYGYKQTAGEMLQKLIQHGEGILDNSPLRETYNPLTGEGMTVPNFGWTAACLLRMICLDN